MTPEGLGRSAIWIPCGKKTKHVDLENTCSIHHHQLRTEELEAAGDRSKVCSQIFDMFHLTIAGLTFFGM